MRWHCSRLCRAGVGPGDYVRADDGTAGRRDNGERRRQDARERIEAETAKRNGGGELEKDGRRRAARAGRALGWAAGRAGQEGWVTNELVDEVEEERGDRRGRRKKSARLGEPEGAERGKRRHRTRRDWRAANCLHRANPPSRLCARPRSHTLPLSLSLSTPLPLSRPLSLSLSLSRALSRAPCRAVPCRAVPCCTAPSCPAWPCMARPRPSPTAGRRRDALGRVTWAQHVLAPCAGHRQASSSMAGLRSTTGSTPPSCLLSLCARLFSLSLLSQSLLPSTLTPSPSPASALASVPSPPSAIRARPRPPTLLSTNSSPPAHARLPPAAHRHGSRSSWSFLASTAPSTNMRPRPTTRWLSPTATCSWSSTSPSRTTGGEPRKRALPTTTPSPRAWFLTTTSKR